MRNVLLRIGQIIVFTIVGGAALPAPDTRDLSTTHILRGLYDFNDWRPTPPARAAVTFGAGTGTRLPMYTERWGAYRDVSMAGLGDRPLERTGNDWTIGWESHFGLLPEIPSRVGIPMELKPDQRGLRLGANYRF